MRLTGDRCQCPTCGLYFNSTHAFDKHRTGDYGVRRECLPVLEMAAKGMRPNAGGWWVGSLMAKDARQGYLEREISASQDGKAIPLAWRHAARPEADQERAETVG